ncbi:hypothetical protein A3Q56_07434, partial [Intoshia linei]
MFLSKFTRLKNVAYSTLNTLNRLNLSNTRLLLKNMQICKISTQNIELIYKYRNQSPKKFMRILTLFSMGILTFSLSSTVVYRIRSSEKIKAPAIFFIMIAFSLVMLGAVLTEGMMRRLVLSVYFNPSADEYITKTTKYLFFDSCHSFKLNQVTHSDVTRLSFTLKAAGKPLILFKEDFIDPKHYGYLMKYISNNEIPEKRVVQDKKDISNVLFKCDFEKDLCGMEDAINDNWGVDRFKYTYTKNLHLDGQHASINTPTIDCVKWNKMQIPWRCLEKITNYKMCVSFRYKIRGNFNIKLYTVKSGKILPFWITQAIQADEYQCKHIPIERKNITKIGLTGWRNDNYSELDISNLMITNGLCGKEFEYDCSEEFFHKKWRLAQLNEEDDIESEKLSNNLKKKSTKKNFDKLNLLKDMFDKHKISNVFNNHSKNSIDSFNEKVKDNSQKFIDINRKESNIDETSKYSSDTNILNYHIPKRRNFQKITNVHYRDDRKLHHYYKDDYVNQMEYPVYKKGIESNQHNNYYNDYDELYYRNKYYDPYNYNYYYPKYEPKYEPKRNNYYYIYNIPSKKYNSEINNFDDELKLDPPLRQVSSKYFDEVFKKNDVDGKRKKMEDTLDDLDVGAINDNKLLEYILKLKQTDRNKYYKLIENAYSTVKSFYSDKDTNIDYEDGLKDLPTKLNNYEYIILKNKKKIEQNKLHQHFDKIPKFNIYARKMNNSKNNGLNDKSKEFSKNFINDDVDRFSNKLPLKSHEFNFNFDKIKVIEDDVIFTCDFEENACETKYNGSLFYILILPNIDYNGQVCVSFDYKIHSFLHNSKAQIINSPIPNNNQTQTESKNYFLLNTNDVWEHIQYNTTISNTTNISFRYDLQMYADTFAIDNIIIKNRPCLTSNNEVLFQCQFDKNYCYMWTKGIGFLKENMDTNNYRYVNNESNIPVLRSVPFQNFSKFRYV